MTIADVLRQEGRVDALRRLLVFKFGALDRATEARLQATTLKTIERYLRRVLIADSVAEVFHRRSRRVRVRSRSRPPSRGSRSRGSRRTSRRRTARAADAER